MALGGTLTEDTFIDTTGKVFGLQGLDITALMHLRMEHLPDSGTRKNAQTP
jgi:hypothetical protein